MKTQNKVSRVFGIKINFKKYIVLVSVFVFQTGLMFSQSQTYDNFEGVKRLHYGERTGVLDTLAKNPAANNINSTKKCAKYVRNGTKKFDNIKMIAQGKLADVDLYLYATYDGMPPKITMKVYTNAPVGTLVEIQLGKQGKKEYPAGINSQYQAYTTISNGWEVLEFKFSQIPEGSEISSSEIDQITLLFNPNSLTTNVYYFDDLAGSAVIPAKSETSGMPMNNSVKKVK
ncbi:MAG: hypothetical protein HYU69_05245 [Bacteroidetes bacterium]|nr:hypothetical protein [Bacteroidota bacterium]